MKLAYLILAHTDPKQLYRLVKSLDYNSDFYIHLDSKTDITDFEHIKKLPNVKFVDRLNVHWGGFNMIKATNNLIEEALIHKEIYSHFILLSGLDYPLKSNKEIHNYFEKNKNINFIRGFKIEDSNLHYSKQVMNFYFNDTYLCKNRTINKLIRKLNEFIFFPFRKKCCIRINNQNIIPCFGSQWWALTPECCSYIINFIKKYKQFDNYFRYSFAPDEKYYHTLVFNSPYSQSTIDCGTGDFYERGTFHWANLHMIDRSLSKIYTEDDFKEIRLSDKLFIRKLNSNHSEKLLDLLDIQRSEEI